jgi:hypothetical protein
MNKRTGILILLSLLMLLPLTNAFAKPNAPVIIMKELSYATSSTQTMGGSNDVFMADVGGWIDCNGVEACYSAGLDGGTVTLQQAFWKLPDMDSYSEGMLVENIRTAGKIKLPGEYPVVKFRGKGSGSAECLEDVCHFTFEFNTKTKGGMQLVFRINIDHTSAGWAEEFEGNCLIRNKSWGKK